MSNNNMASKEAGKALGEVLAANSTLQELDISNSCDITWAASHGTNNGPGFASGIANGIENNGVMTSLNISGNGIGQLVLPEGWEEDDGYFYGPNDEVQNEPPEGSSPAGVLAMSNAIPSMAALTSLNLAENHLGAKGVKHVATAINGHVSVLRFD